MAPRSEMWSHLSKVMVDGVLQKGKQNYCIREIKVVPHINVTSQSILKVNKGDSPTTHKFDSKEINKDLAKMIIENVLSCACSKKPRFRKIMSKPAQGLICHLEEQQIWTPFAFTLKRKQAENFLQ